MPVIHELYNIYGTIKDLKTRLCISSFKIKLVFKTALVQWRRNFHRQFASEKKISSFTSAFISLLFKPCQWQSPAFSVKVNSWSRIHRKAATYDSLLIDCSSNVPPAPPLHLLYFFRGNFSWGNRWWRRSGRRWNNLRDSCLLFCS